MCPNFIQLLVIAMLLFVQHTSATIYDWAENEEVDGENRSLRLNIPDTLATGEIRGILIYANAYRGDSLHKATDPELVAFASGMKFAVLSTAYWLRFSDTDDAELHLFESAIGDLAAASGHPELIHAPWLPTGFSNGGQFSYGLAAKRPEKVIAFIVSKGRYYNTYDPGASTRKIPGLLIAGEADTTERRDSIYKLYSENRALGALWCWVEEEATGHEEHNENHLKLPFLAEVCRLRYPDDQSPADGPVILKDLKADSGWLVDPTTWASGFTEIHPYAEVSDDPAKDPLDYGWVPNEKIAMLYRGFASRLKASADATSVTSPSPISNTAVFSPSLLGNLSWDEIEGYVDGHSLGTITSGETVSWSVDFKYGGMYAFHAVVTLPDNSQRVVYLNRVYVEGDTPETRFENWLYDSYEPALQSPYTVPNNDGVTNIEIFAFDLENNPNNIPQILAPNSALPVRYQFSHRGDLEESGVNIEVKATTDPSTEHWEAITEQDPSYSLNGNTVTIDLTFYNDKVKFIKTFVTSTAD